jgi:hypothetical protein
MQFTIEATENEIIIRLPNSVKFEFLQQILDYLAEKESLNQANDQADDELVSKSKAFDFLKEEEELYTLDDLKEKYLTRLEKAAKSIEQNPKRIEMSEEEFDSFSLNLLSK